MARLEIVNVVPEIPWVLHGYFLEFSDESVWKVRYTDIAEIVNMLLIPFWK